MMIFPMIELQGGRCVSLDKGRLDAAMLWHVDPVETARGFAQAGAEWMHVTDFDAISGESEQQDLIEQIIRSAGIPVQLGGGFRSMDQAAYWLDKGVGRIVVGSWGTRAPEQVKELAKYHPDQVVLSVDVWQGQVMCDGWSTPTALDPAAYIAAYDGVPLAGIMITDIDSETSDTDAQMGVIAGLAGQTTAPVLARGTVRSVDDIARLKYVPNIAGAVVGRALFQKTIDLEEALAVARPEPEPIAEFQ